MLLMVFIPFALLAQDSLSVTIPYHFDFSNPNIALQTSDLIVTTLISILSGYLSPYIPFIRNIKDKELKVAATIIPIIVVICIFGYDQNIQSIAITTTLSLFSANKTHDDKKPVVSKKRGRGVLIKKVEDIEL